MNRRSFFGILAAACGIPLLKKEQAQPIHTSGYLAVPEQIGLSGDPEKYVTHLGTLYGPGPKIALPPADWPGQLSGNLWINPYQNQGINPTWRNQSI